MKKIVNYLLDFLKTLKPIYLLVLMTIMSLCVFVEYKFHIEQSYISIHDGKIVQIPLYMLFYGFPFFLAYLLYGLFYNKMDIFLLQRFWILSLLALLVYSFRCYFHVYESLAYKYPSPQFQLYCLYLIKQIGQGLLLFVPTFFIWFFMEKKHQQLFGFRHKGVDLKPYFLILILMIPIIGLAATQDSFTNFYPLVSHIPNIQSNTLLGKIQIIVYEFFYAFDFFSNEFFFRGFLILAFARIVGKAAILPMTCWYVFIHFGKPVGETISSFFGGLILGLIAYETRSIYGGAIVHIGIAFMMDIFGTIAKLLK